MPSPWRSGVAQRFLSRFLHTNTEDSDSGDRTAYNYQLVDMGNKEIEKGGDTDGANSDDEVLAQLGYTQGM